MITKYAQRCEHSDRLNWRRGYCKICFEARSSQSSRSSKREKGWARRGIELTEAEYSRMLAEQGGVCFICKRPPKTRRLAPDHDHKTGKLGKLLCTICNYYLIRQTWTTPAILRAAADYQEKYRAKFQSG